MTTPTIMHTATSTKNNKIVINIEMSVSAHSCPTVGINNPVLFLSDYLSF